MSTVTITDDTPLDPDDELLVAYLDGELPREERSQLEDRLLAEAALRTRLQKLQSGWDMLEELPNPTPNTKLVETTLELAVADIVKASNKTGNAITKLPWLSRMPGLSRMPWFTGAILASLASIAIVLAGSWWMDRARYESQLSDLSLAENLDAYLYGSDFQLMRELTANPDWDRMVRTSRELDQMAADAELKSEDPLMVPRTGAAMITSVPIDQREAAIREMPADVRKQLYSRWERFHRLDETTREKIRQTAAALAIQPDAESLLETMKTYATWREELPDQRIDSIEQSDGKPRREAIEQAVARSMETISERASRQLSDDTIDHIYLVLQEILDRRVRSLGDEAASEFRKIRRSGGGERDPEYLALMTLFGPSEWRSRRGPSLEMLREISDPLRPEELTMIRLVLSDRDMDRLETSTGGGDGILEMMTLRIWAEEAIRRKSPWQPGDQTTWVQRYLDLTPEKRDVVDLVPSRDMMRELMREWFRSGGDGRRNRQ